MRTSVWLMRDLEFFRSGVLDSLNISDIWHLTYDIEYIFWYATDDIALSGICWIVNCKIRLLDILIVNFELTH